MANVGLPNCVLAQSVSNVCMAMPQQATLEIEDRYPEQAQRISATHFCGDFLGLLWVHEDSLLPWGLV